MKKRVITGVVLALILIPVFVIGGVALNITLLLLTMGASYELFKMYNVQAKLPNYLMVTEILLGGLTYFTIQSYYEGRATLEWTFLLVIGLLVVGALLLVFIENFTANNFSELLVSVLYPAFGFGALFALRNIDLYNLGFLFVITIMTDIFAYFVGVNFGKHRLAVKISPKKSIEGSIGGTVIATIITLVYLRVFNVTHIGAIEMTFFVSVLLIIFISIMGQIGDLVASKLKRHFGIKDYSNIFPGHGGVMDRFDSTIFAAMVLMLVSKVVGLL
ncbi:Phosphatidate cytidylyltransferase [Candidatus Izimaplasma bacterium HR1]|jgi:phosphatidate cytidylyltransferase|uniref:phosphatidate cytidylyltransferase n=1 Tax=Candidatus Izimoplasma sp. HR1 TaxID=1541959 RepID=UPI0004F5B354|nr:Phosphatidate cytidylyltransferase [Candidatus Izimaplasma bacterium HR1]